MASSNNMIYQRLGNTGLIVSRLSFGSWVTFNTSINDGYEMMKAAYAGGINFFDNAEAYAGGESERIMGEAIQKGLEEKVWNRSDLVITTKIFFGKPGHNSRGLSRKHIIEGVKNSLKRLQLEAVDVLYCHRPDFVTPMEEIVNAMSWCVDQGFAHYWGTSEWSATQIMEACGIAERLHLHLPICEQPQYNLFVRQRVEMEYAPLYSKYGFGLTIWSPLATGILTGKYSNRVVPEGSRLSLKGYEFLNKAKLGDDAWQIDAADRLLPIANDLQISLAQLSIAWCLLNKNVSTVILGASSLTQLKENLGALNVVPLLTPEVVKRLEEAVGPLGKPTFTSVEKQVGMLRGVNELQNFDTGFLAPIETNPNLK
jgi:voltage-dependent potassium channel beta subunit